MKTAWEDAAAIVALIAAVVGGTACLVLGWPLTRKICKLLAARDARRVDRELAAARVADQAAWRDFVSGHTEASHPYVRWDHCDQCWAAFDRAGNRGGLR